MKNLFWILLAGAGVYMVYKANQPTVEQMKQSLRTSEMDVSLKNALSVMLPDEIRALYQYAVNYLPKDLMPPTGSWLSQMLQYVTRKYYIP